MKVIAVVQQKGGVGKSTVAILLAAEAERLGQRAMVLELDRQGTATYWSGKRPKAADGKTMPPQVMKIDATQLDQTLSVMNGLGVEIVILDLPGQQNPAINMAIKAADFVILPARAQETDIAVSAEPLAVVQRLHKPYAYILTFVQGQGGRAELARVALESEGHPVCPQFMWLRQEYVDAIVAGLTVLEHKPGGKAHEEISALWKWIKAQVESVDERQTGRYEAGNRALAETRH